MKDDEKPVTKSRVKELLQKYEVENYTFGRNGADTVVFKEFDLPELERFLKKLAKYKELNSTDTAFVCEDDRQKANSLKSAQYPPDRAIVEVHGSSCYLPMDVMHFKAAIEYHSHNYGIGLWYPHDVHIYCTGVMPCTVSNISYKHLYSYSDEVVIKTWFVVSWGITIYDLPLIFSEKMSALLRIDMKTETMQTDLSYRN